MSTRKSNMTHIAKILRLVLRAITIGGQSIPLVAVTSQTTDFSYKKKMEGKTDDT